MMHGLATLLLNSTCCVLLFIGYDIPPHLKLEIAKSHSRAEKVLYIAVQLYVVTLEIILGLTVSCIILQALVKESGATIHTYKPSE